MALGRIFKRRDFKADIGQCSRSCAVLGFQDICASLDSVAILVIRLRGCDPFSEL